MTYRQLSSEQKQVLQALEAYAKKEKRLDIFLTSAVYTALQEEGLHNEARGTGTSVGWRQEIEGKGTRAQRMNLAYSVPHYYRECKEIYRLGMTAPELAEKVQRPEKPYPRPSETLAEAEQILKESPGAPANYAFGPAPGTGSTLQPANTVAISQQEDPRDASPKIRTSGQRLSASGTAFSGHRKALGSLLARTVKP